MGLYDEDIDDARKSDSYRAAASAVAKLRASRSAADLAGALDAVDAAVAASPVIEDSDVALKEWRALCAEIGRTPAGRELAAISPAVGAQLERAAGWTRFEKRDGRFSVSFSHPASWRREDRDDEVRILPATGAEEMLFVRTRALDAAYAMEAFASWEIARLREETPGVEIRERRFVKLGLLDAYEVSLAWSGLEAIEVFAMCGNSAVSAGMRARSGNAPDFFATGRDFLATVNARID